jgi:hypothetical protein
MSDIEETAKAVELRSAQAAIREIGKEQDDTPEVRVHDDLDLGVNDCCSPAI